MNCTTRTANTNLPVWLLVAALLPGTLLGCHKETTAEKAPAGLASPDKETAAAKEGVLMQPEEEKKMAIETTTLVATKHAPETSGYGVVMSHESIAQGVADLATAVAMARQSQAAFKRSKGLAGTAGAMPTDTLETAERQAMVDQAALELQRRRLSSTYGQNPPWKNSDDIAELTSLATGRSQLVRVTFPLGALGETEPTLLRVAHLAAGVRKTCKATAVWRAPADASVPGKSYFALLRGGDFGEGERVLVYAPVGPPEDGVTIPAAAAVITNGKYWYYVEDKPGVFVRTELDTSVMDDAGYFVRESAKPGDKVVTSAAGQLLARDLNPSKEAE